LIVFERGVSALALILAALAGEPGDARAFEVTAARYRFEPSVLEVAEGDRVVLTLRSLDTTHGIKIPAFGVEAEIPKGGAPVTVEFVATKPGTHRFECSEYCGSGHRQMKGRLVVAARSR